MKVNLEANLQPTPASALALASSSFKPKNKANGHAFILPSDIDPELWHDYLEMRQRIRKPATNRAQWLIVGKLANLQAAGHDTRKVIQQSIRNGWQDVFPIRSEK